MRFFLLITLLCICSLGFSQVSLQVISVDSSSEYLSNFELETEFATQNQARRAVTSIFPKLISAGYISASLDYWKCDSINCVAAVYIGNCYKWAKLSKGNVDEYALSQAGFRDKIYNNKVLSQKQLGQLFENLIGYYENNGYPFASIQLDSIEINEESISAQLNLQKNQTTTIDSVSIIGTAKISPIYMHNYLDIKPGGMYNELNISRISTRLTELPFVKQKQPYEVLFTNDYNKLTLFLENKKASRFDGVLGILPDNNTDKVIFTGDIKLLLLNSLGRGESIKLNWRKLQNQTTDLKVTAAYPFVLNTPFGLESKFMLYKRDTTFQDVQGMLGVQYILPRGNYFKVFADQKQSRLLSTKGMENISSLPSQIDVNNTTYGLGLRSEKLDYKFNPTRGYQFFIEGGAGTRQIIKNSKLPEQAYDDVQLNTLQLNGIGYFSYFIPIKKQATLKFGAKGAHRYNEQLFKNELYRIGGLLTLRGFDEESINASSYAIGTIEFRYLLEQNSYTYLFIDGGYYENKSIEEYKSDTPFGFGLGISFETKAGIFSLNYALGYQENELAPLRAAKIHFGFVNFF